MSIIRAIKHRLGLSVTPANNFVLDASAENGTMKLARESGQDIMTVDAAGKVGFSVGILGFTYTEHATENSRALAFPSWLGGMTLQWGYKALTPTVSVVSFAVNSGLSRFVTTGASFAAAPVGYCQLGPIGATTFQAYLLNPIDANARIAGDLTWIAITK